MRLPRPLDAEEVRVLGSLLEKGQLTPDLYPMTLPALLAACNQKTSREPVTELPAAVATGALDVGVDEAGNLAAADQAGTMLTPLPPQPEAVTPLNPAPTTPVQAPTATNAPAGGCWRYVDGGWRKLPNDLTLNACVQTLFAGRCERPGGATYGRWMQQTLRLVPGKVEVSGDNRSFRPLAEQAQNCSISTIG